MSDRAKVLGHSDARFKYPGLELFAPAQHSVLHAVADNKLRTRRTDQVRISAARDVDGHKSIIIEFPKVGVHYQITSVSELQRFRDSFDAMLDQLRRPGVNEL